jgi:glycosyltransferase involved in cell wall biosynthesis
MNLLIVSSSSPVKAISFIRNQIEYLHPAKVLYHQYRPYLYDHHVSIFPFPLNINIIRVFVKRALAPYYTRIYNSVLSSFLRQNRFDAVLCNYGTYGANITDACYRAGIPLIVHFHGYDAFVHKTLAEYAPLYRNMFDKAACIIAVSEDMRRQLIRLGAPAGKLILRPYGVDITLFTNANPSSSSRTLLFVGRFTAKKDPVSLLKAFHYALQSVPDARLVMVGKGELQHLVLKTIEELHLPDSVKVLGWQKSEEVARQMQQARAYVQHSIFAPNGDSEGSPVSIIEAAGSGLPVISTRHAGIKESVIEGVTGYLVDEGDWQTMGQYMVKLLNDPELAGRMGQAGRRHILKNYDVKQQMETLQDILEKAVK